MFPQQYKEILLSVIIGLTKLHIPHDTLIKNYLNGGYVYLIRTHLLISVADNLQ